MQRGSSVVLALVVVLIVSLAALALLLQAALGLGTTTGSDRRVTRSLYAAESGITLAITLAEAGELRSGTTFPFVHGAELGYPGPAAARFLVTVSDPCQTAPPSPVLPNRSGLVWEYPRYTVRHLHLRSQAIPSLSPGAGSRLTGTAVEAEVAVWPVDQVSMPPPQLAMCNGESLAEILPTADEPLGAPSGKPLPGRVAPVTGWVSGLRQGDPAGHDALKVEFSQQEEAGEPVLFCTLVANGEVIYRQSLAAPVAGGLQPLDSDLDGRLDLVYFADTHGGLWRLETARPVAAAAVPAATGQRAGEWTLHRFFRLRQPVAGAPRLVPLGRNGGETDWALVIGSDRPSAGVRGRLYLVRDRRDRLARDERDLVWIDHHRRESAAGPRQICAVDRPDKSGWVLVLAENEWVHRLSVAGTITFTTFGSVVWSEGSEGEAGEGEGEGAGSVRWKDERPAGEEQVYTVSACLAEPCGGAVQGDRVGWTDSGEITTQGDQNSGGRAAEGTPPFGGHHLVLSWRQEEAS